MNKRIFPFVANGTVKAPSSKSFAHRLIIAASLSSGKSTVTDVEKSEDILATVDCIKALGAEVRFEKDVLEITPVKESVGIPVLPCRESGSTLRFFLPIALALNEEVKLTGTKRLIERGVGIYKELFCDKGISIESTDESITAHGKLCGGNFRLCADVSSQFVTGLLFALPLLSEDSVIELIPPVESRSYINITLGVLKSFGICIEALDENRFFIKGGQSYNAGSFSVEGDWSNAAFLYGFNLLGGSVDVEGLNKDSLQGDKVCLEYFDFLKAKKEIDLSDCPDLAPVLFALAAVLGKGDFVGTRRLAIKESNRALAMKTELEKFGVNTEISENAVKIRASGIKTPNKAICSHNDHRIVMALTLLLSITGGEIENAEAVNKSFPDFFERIKKLGGEIRDVD